MSKRFTVQISYEATVDAFIEAETEAEAKGLAEKYSLYESTVLLGIGSNHAETITSEQQVLVLEIEEYTAPDQFQPETRKPSNLKIVEMLREVLETEVGEHASNYDWQEHLELSDEEYMELQEALPRLSLSNDEEGAA